MDASAKPNIEIDERSRSNVYRPDIDVLRAIAVLSVLCFHWGISPFSGGFVGVDVFFVISIISVILFSSNIFFWQEAGYFDTPAAAKPLLHTWSLSVEEKFYLVFPMLIFLAAQRSKAPNVFKDMVVGLLAICFASLLTTPGR
jgi:peptidoglycan/LPS O-acetylase OafA/YrhL